MKHPALTRVFAIVLCILCLVMLLAAVLGLSSNDRDRQKKLDDLARLQSRIDDYREVTLALEGTTSYEEVSAALDERSARHEEEAAKHRTELATYTATQGGISEGIEALDEADWQFAQAKQKYEEGRATFAAGYDLFQQAKQIMAQLWQYYDAAATVYYSAQGALGGLQNLDALLSDGGELTRGDVVSAYDQSVAAVDQGLALMDTIQELTPALDAIAAMDPGDLSDLDGLAAAGVEMPVSAGEIQQMKASYDEGWAQVKVLIAVIKDLIPQINGAVEAATGMDLPTLRTAAQAERDALAAEDLTEPLNEEQAAMIRAAYQQNSGAIQSGLSAAGEQLDLAGGYMEQIRSFLEQMQARIDEMESAMEQGRAALDEAGKAIETGGAALYQGRAMIWYQMGQQEEKAEELRQEKETLEAEARELEALNNQAKAQQDLEQRQKSLRLMLLERDPIRERVDAGDGLLKASEEYAASFAAETEREYCFRRIINYLMLTGAVLSFVALPAAFESVRSRFLLIAPVLLCLLCAAAAEGLCRYLGRGDSYSALAAAAFALIQLLVSVPQKKTKKT